MDGWAETYYRTEEDFVNQRNKVLPYAVDCKVKENIGKLTTELKDEGYTYAVTVTGTPNLMTCFLVNTEFKKYAKIPYPAHFDCIGNRVYTIEEFLEEMLKQHH